MIKVALVGAGKMGISHLSILGAHKDVEIVGVSDTSKLVIDFLGKYSKYNCFTDYKEMLAKTRPDALVVAVPTKFHYQIIKDALEYNCHIFAEKPFCLNPAEGWELIEIGKKKNRITQVGYHNKFIGTFHEVKKILASGAIGKVYHFVGESYGPVVTVRKKATWRSDPAEGGGCLLDYASHVIDLVNDLLSPVKSAKGTLLKAIFSEKVEDSVYSLLELESGTTGVLSVNWSDETYRKMSTSVTIIGDKGKIVSDANELKVFLKEDSSLPGYSKGWNVRYITELTDPVDFYLRGEEYSSQLDYFVACVQGKKPNTINTFESAYRTNKAIEIVKNNATLQHG